MLTEVTPRQGGRGHKPAYKLDYRIGIGLEYLTWADTDEGKASATNKLRSFATKKWLLKDVPKKTRQFVSRCGAIADEHKSSAKVWKAPHVRCSRDEVHRSHRLRASGQSGRPVKAMCLREGIWDWFVSIRAAVATRIPPKLVIAKGKALASEMVKEMARTGTWIDLPNIDKHWLQRWKRHYGVSLRKPNRKYKCSKSVLLARLRAMWITTARLRVLAKFALKRDLVCEGYDQKRLAHERGRLKEHRLVGDQGRPRSASEGEPRCDASAVVLDDRRRQFVRGSITPWRAAIGDPLQGVD